MRKDEGSKLSVIKGTIKKDAFFFTFKLKGPGLDLKNSSPKKKAATSEVLSPTGKKIAVTDNAFLQDFK